MIFDRRSRALPLVALQSGAHSAHKSHPRFDLIPIRPDLMRFRLSRWRPLLLLLLLLLLQLKRLRESQSQCSLAALTLGGSS